MSKGIFWLYQNLNMFVTKLFKLFLTGEDYPMNKQFANLQGNLTKDWILLKPTNFKNQF